MFSNRTLSSHTVNTFLATNLKSLQTSKLHFFFYQEQFSIIILQ